MASCGSSNAGALVERRFELKAVPRFWMNAILMQRAALTERWLKNFLLGP